MIKIHIPQADGTIKTFAAKPITMGMQKALARYGRDTLEASRIAQNLQEKTIDTVDGLAAYEAVMETTANLTETQSEIVLRAFGGQFGPDDLDNVEVVEITRVIQELQCAAYGVVSKNA